MGVGETHGNAYDFFLTTRLKIVRYACYPQNCERFNRFENKNFLVTHPYPDAYPDAHSGPESV